MEEFNREDYVLDAINTSNGSYYLGNRGNFRLIRETDETIELLDYLNKDLIVLNKTYVLSCHYVRKKQD